jgi:hypothetical protein
MTALNANSTVASRNQHVATIGKQEITPRNRFRTFLTAVEGPTHVASPRFVSISRVARGFGFFAFTVFDVKECCPLRSLTSFLRRTASGKQPNPIT